MTYKIASPEDYPEVEDYAFKVIRAYSKCSSDLLIALVTIDSLIQAIQGDELDREIAVKLFKNFTKKFKS